jgi:hypothetical protein
MIDMPVGDAVESGCEGIYHNQNKYFLDLAANQGGIGNYTIIRISSTYMNLKIIQILIRSLLHRISDV